MMNESTLADYLDDLDTIEKLPWQNDNYKYPTSINAGFQISFCPVKKNSDDDEYTITEIHHVNTKDEALLMFDYLYNNIKEHHEWNNGDALIIHNNKQILKKKYFDKI